MRLVLVVLRAGGVVDEHIIIYTKCRYSIADPAEDPAGTLRRKAPTSKEASSVSELLRMHHALGSEPRLTSCVARLA